MSYADFFSPDYDTARRRFRAAAEAAGATLESHPIDARGPQREELTIDVGLLGDPWAPAAAVVSGGLHGVEGFFGSAVQLAVLARLAESGGPPPGVRLVLLHGLNPYGMAWRRRFNEDNVDLNRNFLLPGEPFAGSPPLYARLDGLFNPASPPPKLDLFPLAGAWAALRYGMKTLRRTLPVGQHDFPRGLFFGGHGPAQTQRIVAGHLARWLGEAAGVVHLDLHTGLGRGGRYKLLVEEPADSPRARWFRQHFGHRAVSAGAGGAPAAYPTRGSCQPWCQARFPQRDYRIAAAEFGTYPIVKVVAALRAENRAHFHCRPDDPAVDRTRRRLVEVFAPASSRWRETVVRQGLEIVDRAVAACCGRTEGDDG